MTGSSTGPSRSEKCPGAQRTGRGRDHGGGRGQPRGGKGVTGDDDTDGQQPGGQHPEPVAESLRERIGPRVLTEAGAGQAGPQHGAEGERQRPSLDRKSVV